ncbi:MAG: MBOAT family protein [Lachnospiraceae bacterium]|nr:MBOAT family protein [Lachnospiraceae bacterium]
MVFSSVIFLFFFLPVTLAGYYIVPSLKWKNIWLLIASLFFYFWGGSAFFPVIIFSIVVNYLSGLLIYKTDGNVKRFFMIIAVFLNLLNLGYFKYAGFLMTTIRDITHIQIEIPEILLPIGISFFTFQGMSYVLDVYRGKEVQKNILYLGLYIALFPQLIAGPIVRYGEIEKQITVRPHSVEGFAEGIRIFCIGLAKKAVIANSLAIVCDPIMDSDPKGNTAVIAWIGIIYYTLQLYFDFSGYSDMAIGLGRMFGFTFPQNFNYPYISRSPSEFWRRWHMSLSAWFKDYVYIPLGGSRRGNVYINLFIVFLLTGVWHGASWNMIIWGIYWGILVIGHKFFKNVIGSETKDNSPVKTVVSHILMAFCILIGWVFFRAPNISHAIDYLKVMFGSYNSGWKQFDVSYYIHKYELFILILAVFAMLPVGKKMAEDLKNRISPVWYSLICSVFTIVLFGISILYVVTETYNPFIYFRF